MKSPVVLRGGRADGKIVDLPASRTIYVEVVGRTAKTYPAGTWGSPDGPPVTVDVIEYDTYVRVDESTFVFREVAP